MERNDAPEASWREAYAARLDADVRTFIEETEACYPPDAADLTVERQRTVYDAMARTFAVGRPVGIVTNDTFVDAGSHTVPVRVYDREDTTPQACVVFYHGGGFVVGGLESHDDVCAEICAATRCRVVSVDYRLSPEHVHPAAFDDALDAYDWVGRTSGLPLVLCGDSAGGNLAAAVAHAKRGSSREPAGQVLIYPSLGFEMEGRSYREHANAPMLTMDDLLFYREIRSGNGDRSGEPTFAPLADGNLAGLPPTFVASAEFDPLASDGERYCQGIREAGGRAIWFEDVGLVHGHLRARHRTVRAGESFARVIAAIGAFAAGEWPYAKPV
ncbi:alpha/beta hydrolase [Pararhizobium mangrovi]|uniref:Alpha/beta hydrolase n=1 Tax=Pararhizobium mangrovi TaxID=2590452 RepID=A0A506U7S9_9HYPH|nr:alpha/beta hydrolase [Pararhizobium mangrovi]TPW27947.1 alpha/beta hydrolase [Pararhizobium mangrovi]